MPDSPAPRPPIFLTAEWRSLVMINYAIDPVLLQPYLPDGLELDLWQGEALVSMVGFLFQRTKVLGVGIPWHRDFEEVNLRFYVRRSTGGRTRGVIFIREIVPRLAIALVARVVYNEPYVARPMRHRVPIGGGAGAYEFSWWQGNEWLSLGAETAGEARPMAVGSAEEFIFEHYWGYTRQRDGRVVEYQVEHEPWRVWAAQRSWLRGDLSSLYGAPLASALTRAPHSAFVAEGSPVIVRRGVRLPAPDESPGPQESRSL